MCLGNETERNAAMKNASLDLSGFQRELAVLERGQVIMTGSYRDLAIAGEVTHWTEWIVVSLVSVLIFLGGLWVYRRLRPAFADVL